MADSEDDGKRLVLPPDRPITDPLERKRLDRILIDRGSPGRNLEANRLIFPGPGSLVLVPSDPPAQIAAQDFDPERSKDLGEEELRILVGNQKEMAAKDPAILRQAGAAPEWIAKVEAVLADERPMNTRDELYDYYLSYFRVAVIGVICFCARLARAQLSDRISTGPISTQLQTTLDRLDAYWMRGERGAVPPEELLTSALEAAQVSEDLKTKKPLTWASLPEWAQASIVTAGVAVAVATLVALWRRAAGGARRGAQVDRSA